MEDIEEATMSSSDQFESFERMKISRNEDETKMLQKVQADFSVRIASIIESERTRLLLPESTATRSSVLVLPKLNTWADFLTKKVVEDVFNFLVSFSIGTEDSKRIVICDQKVIQRKVVLDAAAGSTLPMTQSVNQDAKVAVDSEESLELAPNRVKKPEKEIYVPLKRRSAETSTTKTVANTAAKEVNNVSSVDPINGVSQPSCDVYWTKLKKTHLEELFNIVGDVEIIKPEWDDFGYDMQITLQNNLVEHIIEAYNFDKSFTELDIMNVLAEFKDAGFSIKWIDDSHALLIFRNKETAAEALTVRHPILQLRPVIIASRDSKLKIKRNSEFLLPFKERPVTVPTVARRLISSSLGLRTNVTPTLKKEEEEILQKARDDKQRRQRTPTTN